MHVGRQAQQGKDAGEGEVDVESNSHEEMVYISSTPSSTTNNFQFTQSLQ